MSDVRAGRILYFAYGSNMDPDTFGRRRGIAWQSARPGVVRGWRLEVDKPSLLGTGEAMATIVRDETAEVFGVLYDISEEDFAHLELTEGVRIGHYERAEIVFLPIDASASVPIDASTSVPIDTASPEPIAALALVSDHRDPTIRPTTRYRKILVDGARGHGLPPEWIARLEALEAVEETAEHAALRPFFDRAMTKDPAGG